MNRNDFFKMMGLGTLAATIPAEAAEPEPEIKDLAEVTLYVKHLIHNEGAAIRMKDTMLLIGPYEDMINHEVLDPWHKEKQKLKELNMFTPLIYDPNTFMPQRSIIYRFENLKTTLSILNFLTKA